MTEIQLQQSVEELAGLLGWWAWHDRDSRRNKAGLPDLLLVRGSRVLWRELKTQSGRVRPEQRQVLAMLTAAGQDAGVWRPQQWTDGTIRKELT
jgi:hypothetical protein